MSRHLAICRRCFLRIQEILSETPALEHQKLRKAESRIQRVE
jgi:hypothetical protein